MIKKTLLFAALAPALVASCRPTPMIGAKQDYFMTSDRVGNGGSVIVDGVKYELADLKFKPYVGDSFTFDAEFQERLIRLKDNLGKWRLHAGEFFSKQVLSDLVQIYFVPSLPADCTDHFDTTEGVAIQFACTRGWVTWIVPSLYVQLPEEQKVAALIHERLHAYAPSQPHEVISPFVKGAAIFQKLYTKEGPLAYKLTQDEQKALTEMRFSARQLAFDVSQFEVHGFGGGRLSNSVVAADAYVSLDSEIRDSQIDSGAAITNSSIRQAQIESGVKVMSSYVGGNWRDPSNVKAWIHSATAITNSSVDGCVEIFSNTKIDNSKLYLGAKCDTGFHSSHIGPSTTMDDVQVRSSKVRTDYGWCESYHSDFCGDDVGLNIGAQVLMKSSYLGIGSLAEIGDAAQIAHSTILGSTINLGAGVKIEKSEILTAGHFSDRSGANCHTGLPVEILGGEISNSVIANSLTGLKNGYIRNSTIGDHESLCDNVVPLSIGSDFTGVDGCMPTFPFPREDRSKRVILHDYCAIEVVPR